MTESNSRIKLQFQEFVQAAADSAADLEYLADNLGEQLVADYSVKSLEKAEKLFWQCVREGMPAGFGELSDFAGLLARYFGECAIRLTNARWALPPVSNPLYPQPVVTGYGTNEWDLVYPVDTALHLQELPRVKPHLAGVREQRVFAAKLENLIRINRRSQASGH